MLGKISYTVSNCECHKEWLRLAIPKQQTHLDRQEKTWMKKCSLIVWPFLTLHLLWWVNKADIKEKKTMIVHHYLSYLLTKWTWKVICVLKKLTSTSSSHVKETKDSVSAGLWFLDFFHIFFRVQNTVMTLTFLFCNGFTIQASSNCRSSAN